MSEANPMNIGDLGEREFLESIRNYVNILKDAKLGFDDSARAVAEGNKKNKRQQGTEKRKEHADNCSGKGVRFFHADPGQNHSSAIQKCRNNSKGRGHRFFPLCSM